MHHPGGDSRCRRPRRGVGPGGIFGAGVEICIQGWEEPLRWSVATASRSISTSPVATRCRQQSSCCGIASVFQCNAVFIYCGGSQPGVHVALGAHLPIWRGAFKVSNRSENYIYILFISKYLYIYHEHYFQKSLYMLIVTFIYEQSCYNILS